MGAPWAPAYACLHLGLWEEDLVFTLPMYMSHVHTWLRYIDDVMMVWRGDVTSLETCKSELNCNDRNIKLTFTHDKEYIAFLDLKISVGEQTLTTKTFRKDTAANTLLRADSYHPKKMKDGIPIGQFLCIKRNCSNPKDYRDESDALYLRFRERGYFHRQLRRAKSKAGNRDHKDLLSDTKKEVSEPSPVWVITQFGTQWESVRMILKKH